MLGMHSLSTDRPPPYSPPLSLHDALPISDGTPWIEVNPNYTEINAETERRDPDSVFSYYRTLIRLRKEYPVFIDGKFELLMEEEDRKSTRLNSSHVSISYAVFCLTKKRSI